MVTALARHHQKPSSASTTADDKANKGINLASVGKPLGFQTPITACWRGYEGAPHPRKIEALAGFKTGIGD